MNKKELLHSIILSLMISLVLAYILKISMLPLSVTTIIFFGIIFIQFLIYYRFIRQNRCQICGRGLENTFPKDFPREFKVCCGCLKVAEYIYSDDRHTEDMIMRRRLAYNHYKRYKDKFDNIFKIRKEKLGLIMNE